jgi:formylglycine-generating enzyme required for sulfatase activity
MALAFVGPACVELRDGPLTSGSAGADTGGTSAGSGGSQAANGPGGDGAEAGNGGAFGAPGGAPAGGQGGESDPGQSGASEGGAGGAAGSGGASEPHCTLKNTPVDGSCDLQVPSCEGLTTKCGDDQESCCTSTHLPGGEYIRSYDASKTLSQDGVAVVGYQDQNSTPAKMDEFWLDRYEVTVGRFRKFVTAFNGWRTNKPFNDDGKVLDVNSTGWNKVTMDPSLPLESVSLDVALTSAECGDKVTWTSEPHGAEDMPINCVTWVVAYAFCIWDGGRLPTEAEWNFAAAAGAEQRAFPWSDPASQATTPDASDANLESEGVLSVGSRAPGKWGHQDLAGNVFEWTRDACTDCNTPSSSTPGAHLTDYLDTTCVHCVHTGGPNRIMRGGSWKFQKAFGRTGARAANAPLNAYDDLGFRCARNPAP